jgi:hypothetical protein
MTQPLNQSDSSLIRSGCHEQRFFRGSTQTPPAAGARPATARADHTWVTNRDLQALRSIQLSLQQWPWARTQALFVDSGPNRRTSTGRVCAERNLSASLRVPYQLSPATGDAQRNLRNQCRASASPRESRLNGSGCSSPRLNQGGRHHRQHDRILSRCRRHAAQRGRNRTC